MTSDCKSVLIVGGGVAGLSTALALADLGINVLIVEKAPFAGGHAVQLSCKATDACVQCGVCLVEEKLAKARSHPLVSLLTGSRLIRSEPIRGDAGNSGYPVRIEQTTAAIDPDKCTNCGRCEPICPEPKALIRGSSSQHQPYYGIDGDHCRHLVGEGCRLCASACPHDAIDLDRPRIIHQAPVDAIVIASGFNAFDPTPKPYGYGSSPNVITNLDLERILRQNGSPLRPSDGAEARKIAFIQCVGSRDRQLNHPWCSEICCGSALRLSRWIKREQPDSAITVFYIDIQTFGTDFDAFLTQARSELSFVRMIPGDIFTTPEQNLRVQYFDTHTQSEHESQFDLVVLSVGIAPNPDTEELAREWGLPLAEDGFIGNTNRSPDTRGIFSAGTVQGPMGIAETIAHAEAAALAAFRSLDSRGSEPKGDL
jgi:heterodisulfide reductase subunit A2